MKLEDLYRQYILLEQLLELGERKTKQNKKTYKKPLTDELSDTQAMKTVVPITAVSLIKYITSYHKPSFSVILVIGNAKTFLFK